MAKKPDNGYANHICQIQISTSMGAPLTSFRGTSEPLAKAAPVANRSGGTFNAGQVLTTSDLQYAGFQGIITPDTSGSGWSTFRCAGYDTNNDPNPDIYNFKTAQTVEFDVGFRVWAGTAATNTIKASPVPTSTFSYTIQDAALALTLSVAALGSVNSMLF